MTTKAKKDYSQGKIYKIEPTVAHDEGDIYIGSTAQTLLCQRMGKHRNGYKQWKEKNKKYTTSYDLFDKYGIDNCEIILLENVNALNYDELVSRETHYIRTLKCVNKTVPLRTYTQYCKDNEDKIRENKRKYREEHKENIKEYKKEYYKKNKEITEIKRKAYYEENREQLLKQKQQYSKENCGKINENKKKYYEANKEVIREKQRQWYIKRKQENIQKESLC